MLNSTFQAPKAWTQSLSVLLLALSLVFGPVVQAQGPPLEAWFTPEEFESGDELTLHIDYGTIDNPVEPSTEIELTFEYEGFDIVSQPEMDVEGSWFCADGNCDATISVDNSVRELKVSISRTDGHAVGGFGRLGKGGVIIIEMDDIHAKNLEAGIALKEARQQNSISTSIVLSYKAKEGKLSFVGLNPATLNQIRIFDITGRELKNQKSSSNFIPIELELNKIYIITLTNEEINETWKLMAH